jgi:hypothetical protein
LMGIMIDEETGQFVGYSDSSSPDGGAVGYWELGIDFV